MESAWQTPPKISPKFSPAVGKIWNMRAEAGLKMKLPLRPRKPAETIYPSKTARMVPPATVAPKVNTLRLYLRAREKKNAMIMAPTSSTMAKSQN